MSFIADGSSSFLGEEDGLMDPGPTACAFKFPKKKKSKFDVYDQMKTSPSFRNVLYVIMSCPVPMPLVYTFLVRHVIIILRAWCQEML